MIIFASNNEGNMAKEKVKIDNPFVTAGYAGAEYFCDREKETADII